MQIRNLNDLFLHTLQLTHAAELAIAEAFPQMARTARSSGPEMPLENYIAQTKERIKRLEQVFKLVDKTPETTKCPAIDDILAEATELTGRIEDEDTRRAAIVAALMSAKHLVLERHATLAAWARELRLPDSAQLLLATHDAEPKAHMQAAGAAERHPDKELVRDFSMGERLTALFDRSK